MNGRARSFSRGAAIEECSLGREGLLLNAGLIGITTTRPHNEHAESVPKISRWQAPSARCHRNGTATTVDPGRGRGRSLLTGAERVGQQGLEARVNNDLPMHSSRGAAIASMESHSNHA